MSDMSEDDRKGTEAFKSFFRSIFFFVLIVGGSIFFLAFGESIRTRLSFERHIESQSLPLPQIQQASFSAIQAAPNDRRILRTMQGIEWQLQQQTRIDQQLLDLQTYERAVEFNDRQALEQELIIRNWPSHHHR